MNYKEAFALAEKKFKKLCARKNGLTVDGFSVYVIRIDEGSTMFFEYAKAEQVEDWYFVYTEHNGFSVYEKEDTQVKQYKRMW